MPKPIKDLIKEAEREVKFGSLAKADSIFQEAIQQIKEIKASSPDEFLNHYVFTYWNFACILQNAAEKRQKNNSLNEAISLYEKAVEYFMQYAELRCDKAFWYKDLKSAFTMFNVYYMTINALLAVRKKVGNDPKNKMEADSKALLQYKRLMCLLKIYVDTLSQQQLQNGDVKIFEKLIQLYDEVLERVADTCNDLIPDQESSEQKIEYCNLALHYYDMLISEKNQRKQPVLPDIYLSWLYVNRQKSKLNNGRLEDAEKLMCFATCALQTNLALAQKADVHLYRREACLANNNPAQVAQETQLFKESFVAAKESGFDVSTLEEDYQKLCESKPIVAAVLAQTGTYPVHPKKRGRSISVDPGKDIQATATDVVVVSQPMENEVSEQQQKKIHELEMENVRLKAAAIATQAQFEAAQKKLPVLEAEGARLQAGLASHDSLAKSYHDLQKKLQAAWQKNNSLAGQNYKLTEELRQVKRQRDDADSQIQNLIDQRRALEAQNARLAQQVNRGRLQQNDEPVYHARYDRPYPDDRDPRNYPYPSYRY